MTQIGNMLSHDIIIPKLIVFIRYISQWVFVADRNFKANHVWAKMPSNDIWLSEGGGMIPRHDQYKSFLEQAMEKCIVRPCFPPSKIEWD